MDLAFELCRNDPGDKQTIWLYSCTRIAQTSRRKTQRRKQHPAIYLWPVVTDLMLDE